MFELLNSPYPVYRLNKRRMAIIIGIGAFVAFFLLVFQPFGTEQAVFEHKNWFLGGYGIVISVSILLMEIVLDFLYFKNLKEEDWKVGKQIIWTAFFISATLVTCYLYKQWFFGHNISWKGFWGFYSVAITIAIFPIIIVTFLDYIYQLQKNQTVANQINSNTSAAIKPNISTEKEIAIQLTAENGKDKLEIPLSQVLYMQSADNYVEIVLEREGVLKKEVLRNTLQRLEKQIDIDSIRRCHRSFMVNLRAVNAVSGNAQGYKLHFKPENLLIPVARSKSKDILVALESLKE